MAHLQLSRTDNCIDEQIKQYGSMVYKIAILYLRNKADAEDVFQDVFLKLFTSDVEFNAEPQRKAWLTVTTINHCKNLLRSVWRSRTVELDELCVAVEDNYSDVESDFVKQILSLPLKYRRVIFLYYYEGYSGDEIAEMLNITPSTVRSQMRRAREMLRVKLDEPEGDENIEVQQITRL